MTQTDVLILGGGPAGAATAIELCRLGVSVALAEASTHPRQRLGETLTAQAVPLLDRLGVGDAFRSQGHRPAEAIRSVWGSWELRDQLAIFNPHGHGWHLDRLRFDALMLNSARERGAAVWTGTKVIGIESQADHWRVRLRSESAEWTIRASFLIDATGRGSFLAKRLGQRIAQVDRLLGLSRRYASLVPIDQTWTLVEAVPNGWWYSAPLPDGDWLAVFMTDADLIGGRHTWESDWTSMLTESVYTRERLNGCSPRPGWHVQSATSSFTILNPAERWLAVGDAVLACDPLAGLGLTIALETGIAAANAIVPGVGSALTTKRKHRYSEALNAYWQDYCRQRTSIYRLETRWNENPFWRHRQNTT